MPQHDIRTAVQNRDTGMASIVIPAQPPSQGPGTGQVTSGAS